MDSKSKAIHKDTKSLIDLLVSHPIAAELSAAEIDAIYLLDVKEKIHPADSVIIAQGETIRSIHLIHSGWGCVYRDLSNGTRQILDFPMRSDFVGLRTADGYCYNSIATITPMIVFEISLSSLARAINYAPKLSLIVIELFSRQRSLLIEHITNIGCRSALVRTAHFLLELGDRAKACGMGQEQSYFCPLTQYQLADALGLTPVHLNRMLRELREKELLTFKSNRVTYLNRQRLIDLAEYDGEFMRMSVFDKNQII